MQSRFFKLPAKVDLWYKKQAIRFAFSGKQRQAWSGRGARDTRDGERRAKNYHPSGASCALRLLRAGLRSPQKREKKTTPILQAARTEEQIKVVYLLCKEIAHRIWILILCTLHGIWLNCTCLFPSLHCRVTKSDSCLIKILRSKTKFF